MMPQFGTQLDYIFAVRYDHRPSKSLMALIGRTTSAYKSCCCMQGANQYTGTANSVKVYFTAVVDITT